MFLQPKKVMVFGTFDGVHPGHIFFLAQAKVLGKKLIVSIARDINVKRIKNKAPNFDENKRLADITKLGIADEVMLGDKQNYLEHIAKAAPDLILLGYDQVAYTENLLKDLKSLGLKTKVKRAKPFSAHIYKSSKLKAAK